MRIRRAMINAIAVTIAAGSANPAWAPAYGREQIEQLYAQAEQYASQGDCGRSVTSLENETAQDGAGVEIIYELATAYEQQGSYPDAVRCLERIIGQWPDFIPAYKSLAEIHEASGDPAAGLRYARRAFQRDQSNTRLLYTYGRLPYGRQFFYARARDLLNRCLAINSRHVAAHILLARIDMNEFRYDSAIAHMEDAIAIRPGDGALYYTLGTIYHDKSIGVRAIECFKKAISLGHRDADVYYRLGLSYYDFVNDYAQACSYFQKAAESDPASAMTHFMLALSYAQQKMIPAATAEKEVLDALGRHDLSRRVDAFLDARPLPRTMGFFFNS